MADAMVRLIASRVDMVDDDARIDRYRHKGLGITRKHDASMKVLRGHGSTQYHGLHRYTGECQHRLLAATIPAMHNMSDDALRAVRERLQERGVELRERIGRIKVDLRRETTPLPRDAPDAAVVMENDEILQAVDESARSELTQIERALERLEAGTYELCENCGERIDAERLRVVPSAARCRRCTPGG